MGERHHPVLVALPDRDGRISGHRESPVAGQGEIVVAPAGYAILQASPEHRRDPVRKLAVQRLLVGGRGEVAKACCQLIPGDVPEQ